MDAMSHFNVSMTTGNSRTFRHRITQPTNATSQALMPRTGTSQQSLLSPPQSLDGWAANAGTMTSFVCKLCGATMGHRRSLLRHQINAHGRQKQKRGRPPIFPSLWCTSLVWSTCCYITFATSAQYPLRDFHKSLSGNPVFFQCRFLVYRLFFRRC